MKSRTIRKFIFLLGFFISLQAYSQTAPPHLKQFGFVAIDCFYDDPLDASNITNYIAEVDTFSNLAHLCVFDYTDNIVSRVNSMNTYCVNPLLDIQSVFFQYVDTIAPSGANYDLYPNFTTRWTSFMNTNAAVLLPSKIGCFYIADEPFWTGISLADMDTVCALLKASFPSIPILLVEAYPTVNIMQVPQAMDWVGFDQYGIFDPQFDPAFLANLDTLKARLSSPNQKIMLIIDDQWLPYYGLAGYPPDTMKYVVQNYYDLAVSDTNVIGLIGYIWPGGLDDPGHLGVRNLTQGVIDKNVEIGQLIKANYSPCNAVGVEDLTITNPSIKVYPNPASTFISIEISAQTQGADLKIYNTLGELVKTISRTNQSQILIDTTHLSNGMYFILLEMDGQQISEKFLVSK
jgi:Secretion system C-terminal sorting domain